MIWQALGDPEWIFGVLVSIPMFLMALGLVIALILLAIRKRRAGAIGIIFSLGFAGGGMVFGFDSEDTGRQYYSRPLGIVQDQLAELSDRLRSYKARHGRYPTNDEQLGVLDDFELRFPVRVKPGNGASPNPSGIRWMGVWYRQGWQVSTLRELVGRSLAQQQKETESLYLTADVPGIEIALGKRDVILVFRDGLACSPWGIPYVYENRNGLGASAFSGSPATDPDGRYSLKVDDGIYLCSISAKGPARELAALEGRKSIRQVTGWVMIGLSVVILLWWTFRVYPGPGFAGWLAMLISLPAGAGTTVGHTCYSMSALFSYRDPATIAAQQELLAKYRDAGVITDATYKRAIEAANPTPPATQPATGPGSSTGSGPATQPREGL